MSYAIHYRGHLTSCNYACGYCPFAKRRESKTKLARDRDALRAFTHWIDRQSEHDWRVLFTPWGEALVRAWYRQAIRDLTRMSHVSLVAAQTNLSGGLNWIADCEREKLALWATYHPTQADRVQFIRNAIGLTRQGVRLSVGMVGVAEALPEIQAMRALLPPEIYLWINPQQPRPRPYTPEEIQQFLAIDPHFQRTARRFPSRGKPCQAGETMFTVDGHGDMRRCHFVDEVIGNIHAPHWESALQPRLCPRRYCDCFLGKSQFAAESLKPLFEDLALARIPSG